MLMLIKGGINTINDVNRFYVISLVEDYTQKPFRLVLGIMLV
jgi:hypothetical protein